ncbi:hypothetical protein [Aestuariivita boseongensis]|uniref:hypothetical protein n=1 Tax=Aestuariivita boseongensis TaxID=1470562 RepID=UPI00155D9414|nr:hypothetical protein [Aestuariivita boseongensis]
MTLAVAMETVGHRMAHWNPGVIRKIRRVTASTAQPFAQDTHSKKKNGQQMSCRPFPF